MGDQHKVHMVQWYPGHIARAERQLKEQLKMVDVVLEVRDARIPVATHHPQVSTWVGPSKLRLLVMNRLDQVSQEDKAAWVQYYKDTKQKMFWTDGKQGDGVQGVKRAMLAASEVINAKRARRGLQSRPVRACVIGFPNIGKSALINRLLGRKAVASYAKPGVTRMLQWVRLEGQLDLLDAPGVIPAAFNDQIAAQRLAICNDIGEAAYVDSIVAAALVQRCRLLPQPSRSRAMAALRARYSLDPEQGSAEEFVVGVANKLFFGEMEKGGQRLLKDYRTGALGAFSLEHPADIDSKRHRDMMLEAAKSGVASSAASEATSVAGGGWIKQTGH
ncbi:P-loop containing nucleoside triphosphate hydrolase protein [Haematococcus lacustris]